MSFRINIDSEFLGDERLAYLGSLTGHGKFDARGRVIGVWGYCYGQRTDVISGNAINLHAGWTEGSFAELMVKADLAEPAGENQFRIKGVAGRYDYLLHLSERGRAAGKASAEARRRKKGSGAQQDANENEQPVNENEHVVEQNQHGVNENELSSTKSNPLTLTLSLPLEEMNVLKDIHSSSSLREERRPSPQDLVSLWNEYRHEIQPEVRPDTVKPGSQRYKHAKARLADQPDLAYWKAVVQRIAASPFCRGEIQRRDGKIAWVANFSWLLRSETHVKVTEGQYDAREGNGGDSFDQFRQRMYAAEAARGEAK